MTDQKRHSTRRTFTKEELELINQLAIHVQEKGFDIKKVGKHKKYGWYFYMKTLKVDMDDLGKRLEEMRKSIERLYNEGFTDS